MEWWPKFLGMLLLAGWFVIRLEIGYWALIIFWANARLLRQKFGAF
ncbi:hypothetical protein Godav_010317 [Gossypium davidsonii]|uniref:Uncharacterized protein n=1 Tax=Gossypium davidsonii TaxID=34287 RepID=A0A7J8SGY9_GOSDV|nr:hypothetical protein [Gossypium davidsonii]